MIRPANKVGFTLPYLNDNPNQPAKVVHLTSVHRAYDIRIFERECISLAHAGYHVVLIAPHQGEEAVLDGVRIRPVPPPHNRIDRMSRTVYRVYRAAVEESADIYHFHDPELIPVCLALRASGHHVLYDIHENVPKQIACKDWLPRTARPLAARGIDSLERWAARQFSALVVANEDIEQRARHLNSRVVLVGNYPRLECSPNFNPERYASRRVVCFGGISRRTCTRTIVQAMGQLASAGFRLMLAGGSESDILAREIKNLPGWRSVDYLGQIPIAKTREHISTAAAALVLFNREPNHFGVGSNRFYEALGAGLPVITSDFPQWKRMIDEIGCGFAVDPEDPSQIAAAISYIASHPNESAEMGRRAQHAATTRFNWPAAEKCLLDLYRNLLATSSLTLGKARVSDAKD